MHEKRIYFSGGTASGKSTLAKVLVPNAHKLELLPSATAQVLRDNPNIRPDDIVSKFDIAAEYQRLVMNEQIRMEYRQREFVSDRCLCFLAYTSVQCLPSVVKGFWKDEHFLQHVQRIRESRYLLFLCPPNRAAIDNAAKHDSGRRVQWLRYEDIVRMYSVCEFVYQVLGLNYIKVPLNNHERQREFVIEQASKFFDS